MDVSNCHVTGNVAGRAAVGGMVGLLDGGSISNCQSKVTINTTQAISVGGLVGKTTGGTISRCFTEGTLTVNGNMAYIGGLVGETTGGTIDQCFSEGTLTATGNGAFVGGLVGKNAASLTNSYSTATITSSYNASGIVAYNYGLVDKCYAVGDLQSSNYAAGIVGYNDGSNAVVRNCVAMNNKKEITFESQQNQQGGGYGQRIIGGIKNGAPAPEMNNYALKTMQVSQNGVPQKVYDDIMNGTAKTAAELTMKATYQELGWNFTNIWKILEGTSYPYLEGMTSVNPEFEKCATPTIRYANGKLTYNCDTQDVIFHSTITDSDISSYLTPEIELGLTYIVSVYATKTDYSDSDVATGILCWIDAEPKSEGLDEDAVTEVKAMPVLIQTQGSNITIQGATEGTPIAIYSIVGKKYGSANAEKDRTTISTSLQPGSVAVVMIGEKAVKILLK